MEIAWFHCFLTESISFMSAPLNDEGDSRIINYYLIIKERIKERVGLRDT